MTQARTVPTPMTSAMEAVLRTSIAAAARLSEMVPYGHTLGPMDEVVAPPPGLQQEGYGAATLVEDAPFITTVDLLPMHLGGTLCPDLVKASDASLGDVAALGPCGCSLDETGSFVTNWA